MRKKLSPEKELSRLTDELTESFNRWTQINENGCSDPHYSDGMNMNLVRNHTIYGKSKIKELCETHNLAFPDVYYRETPPEVPYNYMARASAIRENAKESLEVLLSEPSINELRSLIHDLSDDKLNSAEGIMRNVRSLRSAVENDDLVEMRRYEDVAYTIDRAKEIVGSVVAEDLNPQTSLFSHLDDAEKESPRPRGKKKKTIER